MTPENLLELLSIGKWSVQGQVVTQVVEGLLDTITELQMADGYTAGHQHGFTAGVQVASNRVGETMSKLRLEAQTVTPFTQEDS